MFVKLLQDYKVDALFVAIGKIVAPATKKIEFGAVWMSNAMILKRFGSWTIFREFWA